MNYTKEMICKYCGKKMNMNHMKEVANLLGVELGEEFLIHSAVSGLSDYKFRFTDKVLEYYNDKGNFWN